jgi:putative flippase GtrA
MGKRVANEFWRLTRFSIVGVLATGVYIIAAMIAVEAGGVAPVVGATIGYCASYLVSDVGHLRFTFAVPGRYRDYVLKSVVGSAAAFFLSTIVMWMATKILRIDYRVALVAVAIIVPICSYLVNRFWVFLHPADADSPGQPIKTI